MASFARAHTNLALVKYWGKEDEALRLPSAPSLSLTLDAFYTETRLSFAPKDKFVLDGEEVKGPEADRAFSCLDRLSSFFSLPRPGFLVESRNFVPKSAGFASSASAFCALAAAFAEEFGLKPTRRELSIASRLGSGSASRSVFGGFAEWKEGGPNESFAIPIDERPSMEISVLYLSFGSGEKKIPSTEGMRRSKASPFFPAWREECRKACREAEGAIKSGDFERLGEVAERNACQMHALTLSSGFSYLSGQSLQALSLAQGLREGGTPCYWSCDAGRNAALLCRNSKSLFRRNSEGDHPYSFIPCTSYTVGIKPQTDRKHCLNGVIYRAEKMLTHPESKFNLQRCEQWRFVENIQYTLQLRMYGFGSHSQNNALRPAISPAKRHNDTHANCYSLEQLKWYPIVEGLVHPVGRGRNRNFCNDSFRHCTAEFALIQRPLPPAPRQ